MYSYVMQVLLTQKSIIKEWSRLNDRMKSRSCSDKSLDKIIRRNKIYLSTIIKILKYI